MSHKTEEGNLAVLVDAKTEYTKQLVNLMKSSMYSIFVDIFNTCKEETPKVYFLNSKKV